MIEGDTFEPIRKPINKVDTINHDPFLSQFKYHFIIRKLPIYHLTNDKMKWNEILTNLYKGFNAPFMGHNSIYIIQILNLYPQSNQVDLIVGFRRDQHAMKVYRQSCIFELLNQKFQVQVAQGFKTYLDQLNQQYRLQTAQRQKLKALQNQLAIKTEEVSSNLWPSITQQKPFIRQVSNSISHIQQSPKRNVQQQQKQQGQIIDSGQKSPKRKNSSESSFLSKSSKSHTYQKKKISVSKQFDSENPYNRQGLYIQSRSNKKRNQSSSKSSKSYSSRSRSSSSPSYRKSYGHRNRDRSSRDRHRNNYIKRSSSYSSSYSSQSQKGRKSYRQRHYDHGRQYSSHMRRRSPPRDYRNFEDRKQDENHKYQLPNSLNRVYSYNNRNYTQQSYNPQFNRKYSQQHQYRPSNNRNEEYSQYPKPPQSYYYKNVQDYPYNRQNPVPNEDPAKSGYRNNLNRNNQSNYKGHTHGQ